MKWMRENAGTSCEQWTLTDADGHRYGRVWYDDQPGVESGWCWSIGWAEVGDIAADIADSRREAMREARAALRAAERSARV